MIQVRNNNNSLPSEEANQLRFQFSDNNTVTDVKLRGVNLFHTPILPILIGSKSVFSFTVIPI